MPIANPALPETGGGATRPNPQTVARNVGARHDGARHDGARYDGVEQVDVSVVVPVFNSASTLPALVDRVSAALGELGRTFEIVFVDDGSRDDSWRVLRGLHVAAPEHIRAIQLMRNSGQHNALLCGLRHARGRCVITMDDDLQHPPEEIHRLLERLEGDDLDLVYGVYREKRHSLARNLASKLVNAMYRVTFGQATRVTSLRAIDRRLVEAVCRHGLGFTHLDGLLAWNTQRIGEVQVAHLPRESGKSGYSLAKLIVLALNLFTSFSLLPLQLVSTLGFVFAMLGLGGSLYYLILYLASNIAVPGYASIIIAIMTFGGVQLLSLGILGEYIGRLHLNVNGKPQYSERTVLETTGLHSCSTVPAVPPQWRKPFSQKAA
jgi:undecaprenyl-phosphate 4-deoxy-4-formamido-L-arabinose transferase